MLGWGCRAALDALAETGTDITRFHAGGNLGRVHPAGQPVRQAQRTFEVQELQRYLGGLHETAVAAAPGPAKAPATGGCPPPRQSQGASHGWQHPAEGLPQAPIQSRQRYQDLGADYYERRAEIGRSPFSGSVLGVA